MGLTFGFTRLYHVNEYNNVNITDDQVICIKNFFHLLLFIFKFRKQWISVAVSEFLNDNILNRNSL